MSADRLSRAVPFPEFAPDHLLRFTTADLIALEAAVQGRAPGDPVAQSIQHAIENPWLKQIETLLQQNDAAFVRHAVRLGLKSPGGFERPKVKDSDFDDLPFAPATVVIKIFDAIACAISGEPYAARVAAREAPAQASGEAPDAAAA